MAEERVHRKLAAIIAADVVGYSRLMGADEAGTLSRLNALRSELLHPKVAEYGGRIVKTTGDGTLIEFPSAVDAVQHAVDEQSVKNIERPIHCYRILLKPGATKTASSTLYDRPAVAVLPFENMSGDPEQEYFADGLTEDIITALSLWRSFPVIARNSTFAYKGQSPDIRKVGEELNARYVVEGSVRKAGNLVRVTAQLINADTLLFGLIRFVFGD